MEVVFRQEKRAAYAPATRVYAPTRGSLAYGEPAVAPQPETPEAHPQRNNQADLKARTAAQPRYSLGGKLLIVLSLCVVGVALLFVMMRYEKITSQYAAVNAIKSEIDTTNVRLTELNVALQCATSLDSAQAAAVRLGMTYPSASQYVKVGEPIPAQLLGTMTSTALPEDGLSADS